MPKIVPKSIQTCFERVLGQIFRKIFDQFSMECRVFETFQKKQRIFTVPKKPKIVTKSVQTCFELVLGQFFPKKNYPSVPWRLESSKIFKKKPKKIQNSNQKRTKPFPKESKSVLNMFWGKFFEKFLPSFQWKVESSKIFKKIKRSLKFQKGTKLFPKVSKRVLNVF